MYLEMHVVDGIAPESLERLSSADCCDSFSNGREYAAHSSVNIRKAPKSL